jgi:hypothetical protein
MREKTVKDAFATVPVFSLNGIAPQVKFAVKSRTGNANLHRSPAEAKCLNEAICCGDPSHYSNLEP